MIKSLSRSTIIIFIFDLFVLFGATSITLSYSLNESYDWFIKFSAVAFIVMAGLFSLFLKGNYKIREFNINFGNAFRLLEGVVFAHIPAIIFLYFFISKTALLKFFLTNITIIFIGLLLYRICFHYFLFNFKKVKKILIVGTNERAKVLADIIKTNSALRMEVVDTISNDADIQNIVSANNIDIVIFTYKSFCVNALSPKTNFDLMTNFYEKATGKFYIDQDNISEFAYEFNKTNKKTYEYFKRIFDIVSSLIILTVTLPITGFTALRIWLTDHENPIYTQDRVGKDGKIFKCYKLRTMWANNFVPKDKKKVGYVENQEEDDRVIPWCKFVRKARFDEIPQMLNILKGDMSIVGPRCEWKEVVDVYKDEVLGYSYRMFVNTAWTGWAQINQGYCFASDNEAIKLQYDLYYIKHRNLLWDISILVKAVFLALGGRHA